MRVWFLADLHFGCRADNEIWLKDYSDYFYNVFIPLLKENYRKGDIICSLGDVFDNRSSVGINTINVVIDIFEKIAISKSCIKKGGEPDTDKAVSMVIDDFRSGKLGRITIERPADYM